MRYQKIINNLNMSNNSLVLMLDKLCPYAHRSWIALEEKKVNYTLKEVSLKNK